MASFNKVILMGNLTRDIEIRHTPGGNSVAQIGLAVNEKYKDKNDAWVERVNFIDCEAWGQRGEIMAQYLSKGSPVLIEGKLQLDTWQDKDTGANRSKLKVRIETFEFIGGGQDRGTDAPAAKGKASNKRQDDYDPTPISADDIPF